LATLVEIHLVTVWCYFDYHLAICSWVFGREVLGVDGAEGKDDEDENGNKGVGRRGCNGSGDREM
jgi:hypothetical protein